MDRNGWKTRLVMTTKNERGGRARPVDSKHSGQLTFQLKVEITDQYFIKQDDGSEKPIDNVFDCLSISEHEEKVAKGRTKDTLFPMVDLGITVDFSTMEIVNKQGQRKPLIDKEMKGNQIAGSSQSVAQ